MLNEYPIVLWQTVFAQVMVLVLGVRRVGERRTEGAIRVTGRADGVTGRADHGGSGSRGDALGGRCGAVRVRTGRCVTATGQSRGATGVGAECGRGEVTVWSRHARTRPGVRTRARGPASVEVPDGPGNRLATQFVSSPRSVNIIQW